MANEYTTERQVAAAVIDAANLGLAIFWPDDPFNPPQPADDHSAAYLEVDLEEDESELTDMAGGERIDGHVVIAIWVEADAGDGRIRSLARALRTAFRAGDQPGVIQFLHTRLGAAMQDAPKPRWYARELHVHYTLYRT